MNKLMMTSSHGKYQQLPLSLLSPLLPLQLQWQGGYKQRLFSAMFAVLVSLCLILSLSQKNKYHLNTITQNEATSGPSTLVMLYANASSSTKEVTQANTKKPPKSKLLFNIHNNENAITIQLIEPTADTPVSPSPATEVIAATVPTSSSFDKTPNLLPLNNKEMLRIYEESQTDIQKMAKLSGTQLKSPVKTKYDDFQTAAENAVIPDCLAPQKPNGIGLFALPAIILAASIGKCK